MKGILCAILITITLNTGWSQIEVSLQSAYEVPLDELKWIYKPGTNHMLTVSKTDKYKKKRTAFGGILGYASFKPKEDIFYYLVNESEIGSIVYDKYQVLQLFMHTRRDFILNKKMEFFIGGEFGYMYTKFSYASDDPYIDEEATTIESRIGIAPKIGLCFMLSERLGLFIQSRYITSIGLSDNQKNIVNYSVSGGAGVNFRFE